MNMDTVWCSRRAFARGTTARSYMALTQVVLQQQTSSSHLFLLLVLLSDQLQLGIQHAILLLLVSAAAQRGRTQFAVLHEEKA